MFVRFCPTFTVEHRKRCGNLSFWLGFVTVEYDARPWHVPLGD